MNSISRRQGCSLTGVLLLCTCDLPNCAFSRLQSAHGIREDVPCRAVNLWSAMDWLPIDRPPSQADSRHLRG